METEIPPSSTFTYFGRTFTKMNNTITSSSSAFFSNSDSDNSDEFSPAAQYSRRYQWLTSTSTASSSSTSFELNDHYIRNLISSLQSPSLNDRKQATMEIRLLAKNNPENRLKIARSGAIEPLISLITSYSSDSYLQEYSVTAILNLSLCDENIKELIVHCVAIKPLVVALRSGTTTARENAACALHQLSQIEENKAVIGGSGAIPPLVKLLHSGGIRGKKDASTALYSICSIRENKVRAVEAGIVRTLVELMADFGSSMVDKSAYLMSLLVTVSEGRVALVEEGGIPVVVELVEVGSERQKEVAIVILLQLCEVSVLYRNIVAREGAIPPVVAVSRSAGESCHAKKMAKRLVEILRQL